MCGLISADIEPMLCEIEPSWSTVKGSLHDEAVEASGSCHNIAVIHGK